MILALSGGVGGAKLVQGLARHVPDENLAVVVNTADDFEQFGLHVAPDVDTVMYTLAGLSSKERGWGIANESWNALQMFRRYGYETWFQLGDLDLATNILRTQGLALGRALSAVTQDLCRRLGLQTQIIPMTDDGVTTYVKTASGWLHFQEYFVRERCEPAVLELAFRGIDQALPAPPFLDVLQRADAVILTPSNPVVSLGPILSLEGIRRSLRESQATKVAVTPLIGGAAVKGPTVPLMESVGLTPTAFGVAEHYADFLDIFVLDQQDVADRDAIAALGMQVHVTDTLMTTDADKARLAGEILDLL